LDVWAQFRVLDGGETLGRDFYAFRNYFFFKRPPNRFGQYFIKKELIPVLSSKIYKKCIRKKKEDVLKDLPQQIFQTNPIEMEPSLKNLYMDVKRQIISEIETMEGKTTLILPSILAKLMRLQQITAGFTVKDNKTVELLQKPKLSALIEMLEIIVENEESTIVWCRFLKSISMISETLTRLKIKHLTMSGEDKDKEKYSKWKGFQVSNIPVFIGQVESGGVGIELFKLDSDSSKTQHTIFYENTFSLDVREQAKARVHRIGQKSTCLYVDLVIKDSIDEMILSSLVQKKNISDQILEVGVKKFLEER
jgi:SNF2 family DNA or RNA helicase